MMGMEQPEDPDAPELSELELSAVSEAMNQMMASAAAATSVVLGTEVEIGTPETKTFTAADDDRRRATPHTPHAVRVGDVDLRRARAARPARAERLRRAHVERARRDRRRDPRRSAEARRAAAGLPASAAAVAGRHPRARLGRARARAHALRPDRRPADRRGGRARQAADDAIDLYVNGTHFATGRLVVVDGTDWAVRIEHVLDTDQRPLIPEWRWPGWPESW